MADISKFSDTCVYCYKGISDGLSVCFCSNSLCEDHKEMHFSKFNCGVLYSLSNVNGNVKIQCDEDLGNLEKMINIKIKNGMISSNGACECCHIYDSANVTKNIDIKNIKCQMCNINENLWICLECGHIGCGRKQEGMVGNGHALEHFHSTKNSNQHPCSVLISSISNNTGDTFCYICESFVHNPLKLKIAVKNDKIKNFNDPSKTTVKSDLVGIFNEGTNCYISSVLHLLNEVYKEHDLSDHFSYCDSNPSSCIACQLIKVLNEMKNIQEGIKTIRINGFLNCVFQEMGEFTVNVQEDCSEFIHSFLERLNFYEECMLLPKITDKFNFSINNDLKGRVLYAPFKNSIKECLESCISDPNSSDISFSKFLILNVMRCKKEKEKYVKMEDPIDISSNDSPIKFDVVGCICHKGNEIVSGHYTWWIKKGDKFYVANDSVISESDMKYAENGSLFLLKIN